MTKLFRSAAILGLAVAALAASADPTISLSTPDVTIVRPTSGSVTYDFVGTVAATAGSAFTGFGESYPSLLNSTTMLDVAPGTVDYSGTSTYTGVLFTVTVASTTELGYYGYVSESNIRSTYYAFDDVGASSTPYSITVQAVPEPATLAALGLGASAFLRRRKKA